MPPFNMHQAYSHQLARLATNYRSNGSSDGSHYEKRGKGEHVCIDDEIPFEIPESWAWVRLESLLADIIVPIRDKPAKLDGPIPWCRIEDVEGRYLSRSLSGQGVDEATVQKMNLKVYPVATVLCSNSATIGVPAIIATPCVTNQRFIGFLPAKGFMSEYLYLLFLAFNKELTTVGTGTTHAYISRGKFEQLLVPAPPEREQGAIVEAFDAIEPLVDQYGALEDARERLDSELPDKLRKSILHLVVQGKLVEQDPADEPASALLDRIRAERAALVKAKKLKAPKGGESVIYRASDGGYYEKRGKGEPQPIDVPFDIPESWEWARLGQVVNIVSARRVHQSDWKNAGIPFYRAREIVRLAHNEPIQDALYISEGLFERLKESGVPQAGGLMVTGVGTIGTTYIVKQTDRFYYKDASVLCFENRMGMHASFLDLLMQTEFMSTQIRSASSGTTVATITMKNAVNFLIPIPPVAEQRRIVESCRELLASLG